MYNVSWILAKLHTNINLLLISSEAHKHQQHEYQAAVKIQSWFRGLQTRAYLR